MRNPPRNNPPIRIPNRKALCPPVFLLPCFPGRRAIPLHSCHCFTGHTPPTSSPDTKACIPAAGLPSCHSVFPHHPFLLRSCFRTHLHLVPHPLHSSPSHPSNAHCPPVPLMWACASAAGLPIRRTASPHFPFALPPRAHLHVQRLPHSPPVHRARPVCPLFCPGTGRTLHSHRPFCPSVSALRQPIPGRTKKQRMSKTSAVFQL